MTRSTSFKVLALVLAALAAYLVYTQVLFPNRGSMTEVVVCTECGHVFAETFAVGKGGAPYECPVCGAKSAHLAYQCTDPECSLIFPVTPDELGADPTVVCPDCGSRARRLLEVPPNADEHTRPGHGDEESD